ncbi:hypothetical protein niasHT_038009 [Heterodera trifolii]|uniref:Uncharacterized protein n=1 Tax=Heterodera trifolii TaxID=157864 RepID=A0ABD2HNH1_9BILA
MDKDKKCEKELERLDTLSEHFADVRVLAVAPRTERASAVRALAWQLPRIRFEQETEEAPVWRWFNATPLDKAIFDRCSRLSAWVPSGADFAFVLSLLQKALSASPCGQCEFDSGQKRIHWPSFHPPVPQQRGKANVLVNIDGSLGPPLALRRWNSLVTGEYGQGRKAEAKAEKRGRMHWTVDNEQLQRRRTTNTTTVDNTKRKQKIDNGSSGKTESAAHSLAPPRHQKQSANYPTNYHQQQQKYLYGQQMGQMRQRETERGPNWAEEKQQREGQRNGVRTNEQTPRGRDAEKAQRERHSDGREAEERTTAVGTRKDAVHPPSLDRNYPPPQTRPQQTAAQAEPAPLYPEGSEDAAGDDYYGDEYAAEWTTEAPEAAKQIPKPTKPAAPTQPTTQADKSFGFELPCSGFSDESCFQQQTQLRPNEVHRCCRGRILFTDQCAAGKCSNTTVQLCCIQRFLQAKMTCCSDERQADADVGDHFSRCCFEHFVDGEDPCCPRAYAAEQWRSVHELCLPNVEMDLTGVKVPSPLVGTTLITEFDFSKTDRWRFECRYGSHVQQYSFFEASASGENNDQQQQRNEAEDE